MHKKEIIILNDYSFLSKHICFNILWLTGMPNHTILTDTFSQDSASQNTSLLLLKLSNIYMDCFKYKWAVKCNFYDGR